MNNRITTSPRDNGYQKVTRTRNSTSRYEYPEDRKCLKYWIKASGPCVKPYFRYNLERRSIVITLYRGDRVISYDLWIKDLENMVDWRQYVAYIIRKLRHNLIINT